MTSTTPPQASKSAFLVRWVLLALTTGLIGSGLAAWQLDQHNEARIDEAVDQAAEQAIHAVQTRIRLYEYGLNGARGAILTAGKNGISRKKFHAYTLSRDIDTEFPGARGFGFIRRVPQSREQAFVEKARTDGWLDFRITELNPHDRERFVIQYIEPVERNIQAVGLDIGSEQNRREAAEAAIRTGEVRLTGPITLVQATGNPQQSFLILMPIYRGAETPATLEKREARAFGWSYAPLLMKEVLADLRFNAEDVNLELHDVTSPEEQELFYRHASDADATLHPQVTRFDIYGRTWEARFSVQPAFVERLSLTPPLPVFLLGALISVLAAALLGTVGISRQNRLRAHAEKARLAAIVESSADGIIGKTLDGIVTNWNRGAEAIFGYPAEAVIGRPLAEVIVPTELQSEEADILRRISNGETISHFDTVRQHQDGHRLEVSVTVSPIRDDRGQVVGASKTVRDNSIQKAAEDRILELNSTLETRVAWRTAQLTEVRDQLLLASEVAQLGIWSWHPAEDTMDWNDKMFELYAQPLSLKDAGLRLEHWRSRIHPEDEADAVIALEAAVEGSAAYEPIFRLLLPDGEVRFVQAAGHVERDEQGRATRVTGINLDITAQRELENRLRIAKEEAVEASEAKSQFLANMSHEIRTPMNAVLGMLQLVQNTELSQRQLDYITKAHGAGRSLLWLLNDILDYSKIEAGKLQLAPHPFEIETMMRDLSTVLAGNLGDKPVEVMFDLDPALPGRVKGDRLRLQQVLINLAGNALKFTDRGEVVIELRATRQEADAFQLQVAVSDTGIGIAEEQLQHIFAGFSQAEASTTRRFGGTGLGLTISSRLVELLGGELHVQSQLGTGSRFWFEIPLQLSSTRPTSAPLDSVTPPLHALVVDDNAVSADILARNLATLGHTVRTADNGSAAINAVNDESFDLILMDWQMPQLDGLEAAKHIRGMASISQPIIIMVTAFGQEQLGKAQEDAVAPFEALLTKPVTPQQLAEAIHRARTGLEPKPDRPLSSLPHRRRLQEVRILVVEDNALNRQVAAELLGAQGASVTMAEGGAEAVNMVTRAPEAFDVVLMDVQMPDMDGLEATRRIRSDAHCLDLPILAMTANVTPADQEAARMAGMNGHLSKPMNIELVVNTLLAHLSSLTHSRDTATDEGGEPLREDIDSILQRFGGDANLYRRLLTRFEKDADEQLTALDHARRAEDRAALAAALHTFKGVAGTIGAAGLASRLSPLEEALKQGGAPAGILDDRIMAELEACFRKEFSALMSSVPPDTRATSTAEGAEAPLPDRPMLENLLSLLESGNMQALDVIEQFPVRDGTHRVVRLDELIEEVQNLNFSAASRIVRKLLEEA